MIQETKLKVALVIGAVLSIPVVRGIYGGTIPASSGAIRIAVAMVLAYGGVALVTAVVTGYLPKPGPDGAAAPDDGVEDAVLVDGEPTPETDAEAS